MANLKTKPAASTDPNEPADPNTPDPKPGEGETPDPAPEPNPAPEGATEASAALRAGILAQENQRRTDIRARFKPFAQVKGVAELMESCLDNSAISVSAAADKLMTKLGEGMTPIAGTHAHRIDTGESQREKFMRGATQAVMARAGKDKVDPANEYRGMRMHELARAVLRNDGLDVERMSLESCVKAALAVRPKADGTGMTTSDFPVLLENVMHRQLLTAYNETPDSWSKFCSTGSVSDFRDAQRLRYGALGDIEQVNEAGEYKNKAVPDLAKEKVNVKRHGNIVHITPELIINDDIGYITSFTTQMGRAAKRTIENSVFAYLLGNPKLVDGTPLFHTKHKNIAASGAKPTVQVLDDARVAMASQMNLSTNEYLDIFPDIWLGPLALGGDVRVLVNAQFDTDTAGKFEKPNKVKGIVNQIVDTPRLPADGWYLFASPSVAPVIEVTFLNGQSEPVVEMEDVFRSDGISYKVKLPFGVNVIGYEGAYYNPGK